MNKVILMGRLTIRRRKWQSHDTHLRLTAEEQKTGSSQRISFPALRLDEMESLQKNISSRERKWLSLDGFRRGHIRTETVKRSESKKAAGQQDGNNGGYSDAGDGFMNIPDGIDEELPFN